jgi:hypothetical protein
MKRLWLFCIGIPVVTVTIGIGMHHLFEAGKTPVVQQTLSPNECLEFCMTDPGVVAEGFEGDFQIVYCLGILHNQHCVRNDVGDVELKYNWSN